MGQYSFSSDDLDRVDAEMGDMYYDCPKCGFCQPLGNLAKAVYKANPYEFRNRTCAKCGHEFNAGQRMKFGKCPSPDDPTLQKGGE